jgi:hypothetical protein
MFCRVFSVYNIGQMCRKSSVGITTGYGLDDRMIGVRFLAGGQGIFLFDTMSRADMRLTQPPIQWVLAALSLGVKRQVRDPDHSPSLSTAVKDPCLIPLALRKDVKVKVKLSLCFN